MNSVKTILVCGRPASGKTTIMKYIRDVFMPVYSELKYRELRFSQHGCTYMLGVFDGSITEGTDRLSMGVLPTALEFLGELETIRPTKRKLVFAEGDRLTNRTFIDKLLPSVYYITASEETLRGRHIRRNGGINETVFKARKTKIENLARQYRWPERINETADDFNAIVNDIINEGMNWING